MDAPAVWADKGTYPEMGVDVIHPGLGLDGTEPAVAYMAIRYSPGLVVNVWNGSSMVFDPKSLPVIDPTAKGNGNGSERFGPGFAPVKGGGTLMCWAAGGKTVRILYLTSDGTWGESQKVADGSGCAMTTAPDGSIHMVYVHGGLRYRTIAVQ